MHEYELMVLFRPDASEETLATINKRLESIITSAGGEITETKDWGKRRLAYEVDDFREGLYRIFRFRSGVEAISELERVMNINDHILRHLIINTDEQNQSKEAATNKVKATN